MDDDHQPRENDHLVEPLYAGLGARERERGSSAAEWVLWIAVAVAAAISLAFVL